LSLFTLGALLDYLFLSVPPPPPFPFHPFFPNSRNHVQYFELLVVLYGGANCPAELCPPFLCTSSPPPEHSFIVGDLFFAPSPKRTPPLPIRLFFPGFFYFFPPPHTKKILRVNNAVFSYSPGSLLSQTHFPPWFFPFSLLQSFASHFFTNRFCYVFD